MERSTTGGDMPEQPGPTAPSDRPALRRTARRPRLSDAETEQRMLDAGVRLVAERGLSLSLEHLSIEDLIQDAGVSRTSSYRRWPTKDLFAADLLLRLARATDLPTDLSEDLPGLTRDLADLGARTGDLSSATARRDLVVGVLRIVVAGDFDAMLRSPAWRSHVALRAAHLGLPGGALREQVSRALRETEQRFTDRRAAVFAALADLLGYRLAVPDDRGWHRLSLTLGAVATGLLVRGYADPDAVTATTRTAPFGSTTPADWSEATLASVGVVLGAIEPDPEAAWDEAGTAVLRGALADPGTAVRVLLAAADGSHGSRDTAGSAARSPTAPPCRRRVEGSPHAVRSPRGADRSAGSRSHPACPDGLARRAHQPGRAHHRRRPVAGRAPRDRRHRPPARAARADPPHPRPVERPDLAHRGQPAGPARERAVPPRGAPGGPHGTGLGARQRDLVEHPAHADPAGPGRGAAPLVLPGGCAAPCGHAGRAGHRRGLGAAGRVREPGALGAARAGA
jgi:AcrR family transcriptional regulator